MKKMPVLTLAFALSACSTYMPPRYYTSADNRDALKAVGVGNVSVGSFKGPADFDNGCRAAGPIAPPDNLSFEAYIQHALVDELTAAGMYDEKTPKVTLSGALEKLAFLSSTPSRGASGGSWDLALRVSSSNGKSTLVTEHYEFDTGLEGERACKRTADAYFPVVQMLIGKLVKSPEFKGLVTP